MIQIPFKLERQAEFTAAEALILEILSDGKPHSKYELRKATGMDSADRRCRQLRQKGYNIQCEMIDKVGYYRLVR